MKNQRKMRKRRILVILLVITNFNLIPRFNTGYNITILYTKGINNRNISTYPFYSCFYVNGDNCDKSYRID